MNDTIRLLIAGAIGGAVGWTVRPITDALPPWAEALMLLASMGVAGWYVGMSATDKDPVEPG